MEEIKNFYLKVFFLSTLRGSELVYEKTENVSLHNSVSMP